MPQSNLTVLIQAEKKLNDLQVRLNEDNVFEGGNATATKKENDGRQAFLTYNLSEPLITSLRGMLGGQTMSISVSGPSSLKKFISAAKDEIEKLRTEQGSP